MSVPSDLRSSISTFMRGDEYTARRMGLSIDDLIFQIEDMGLNPVDFIWTAIRDEKEHRSRRRDLLRSPSGCLYQALRQYPWSMRALLDDYGLVNEFYIISDAVMPESCGDIPIIHDIDHQYTLDTDDPDELEKVFNELMELDNNQGEFGENYYDNYKEYISK